jgi:hypothetical protein
MNPVPEKFNNYVSTKIRPSIMDLELVSIDAGAKHYLESFGGWRRPKGNVKGYFVEFKPKRS